ncbi:hypothetical protein AP064_03440 [Candidatus Liberibacter solanacearum]|uniref:hypothetical protein n=2 Tax=Candidatus Liberibacter solanacearum TaxID=556287 RepID=UPI00061EC5F6|nr:hypothetical protein [Candidatus Liberibacter solanacearum]KJZ81483.1 hypothetical protein KP07_01015 [Candidatus Liberibacter solanacearum]KQC49120.1 hypothetical protein AP064_03440 [Candidatus Liberibacter solanacearum]
MNFTKNKRRLYIITISITLSSCFDDEVNLHNKYIEDSNRYNEKLGRITLAINSALIQEKSKIEKDIVEVDQKISNINKQLESSEENLKNLKQRGSDTNWSLEDELVSEEYINRNLKIELNNWIEIRNETLDRKKTLYPHLKQ